MKCGYEILLEDWDTEERSQIPNFDCVLPSTGTAWPPAARFSNVPKLFGRISGDIVLFVSSKRRRLKARNFAVILIFLPFATYEKTPALQKERVGVLGTAAGPETFSGLSRSGPQVINLSGSVRVICFLFSNKKKNYVKNTWIDILTKKLITKVATRPLPLILSVYCFFTF